MLDGGVVIIVRYVLNITRRALGDRRGVDKIPLYDFYCDKCKEKYEMVVPLKHYDADVLCPVCKEVLKRIVTSCMFRIN